jgi:hypothetical protein
MNVPLRRLLRPALVCLTWGLMTSSVLLTFIFQGYFVPGFRPTFPTGPRELIFVAYLLVFLVAVLAGMLCSDLGEAVLLYFGSLAVTCTIEYVVLLVPSLTGIAGPPVLAEAGLVSLPDLALLVVFYSLFPVPLVLGLVGSLTGAAVGESYLS